MSNILSLSPNTSNIINKSYLLVIWVLLGILNTKPYTSEKNNNQILDVFVTLHVLPSGTTRLRTQKSLQEGKFMNAEQVFTDLT